MMLELMSINLRLLGKMKSFWITISCYSLLQMIMIYIGSAGANNLSFDTSMDMLMGVSDMLIVVVLFNSLYIGREYSRGTVKNRIVAGYSRFEIYVSYFIISCIISVLCYLMYFVECLGMILLIGPYFSLQDSLLFTGLTLLGSMVVSAVILLIFSLTNNCTECVVFSLVTLIFLIIVGMVPQGYVGSASGVIEKDEEYGVVMVDAEGAPERGSPEREIMEALYISVPVIQMTAISDFWGLDMYVVHFDLALKIVVFSLIWITVIFWTGYIIFKNKKVR